jgi:hypothetical protein
MKKLILILIPVVAIVILAAVAFIISRNGIKSTTFMLIKENGQVQYKTKADYTTLNDKQIELPSGSFVKTADGGAQVLLPDNSLLSLDKNTEIQITAENGKTDLLQLAGNTWNRVEKLTSGNGFRVETPSIIAAVRGTEFGVLVTGLQQSDVFVTESTVQVGKIKQTQNGADFADSNDLPTGRWYKFDKGQTQIKDIPGQIIESSWYKKNQLLNQLLKNVDKSKLDQLLPDILNGVDTQIQSDVLGATTGVPGMPSYLSDFTQVCPQINTAEFQQYMGLIDQEIGIIPYLSGQLNATKSYLDALVKACADGSIDANELVQVGALQKAVNDYPAPTVPAIP